MALVPGRHGQDRILTDETSGWLTGMNGGGVNAPAACVLRCADASDDERQPAAMMPRNMALLDEYIALYNEE